MSDLSYQNRAYLPITQEEFEKKLLKHEQWRKLSEQERYAPTNKVLSRLQLDKYDLTDLYLQNKNISEVIFRRCNFSGMNLLNINFNNSDLQEDDFSGATFNTVEMRNSYFNKSNFQNTKFVGKNHLKHSDFHNTNFYQATLNGTNLSDSNFTEADLTEAGFTNTSLQKTDFSGAKLAGTQFGGADVTDATFSQENYFEGRLKNVEEASKISRTLYFALLTALALSGLTIFSTKDLALLTNSTDFTLPIVQTPIPIVAFYYIAPVLLTGLFFYFHIYLTHLYKLISNLPAVFQDGSPLPEKIYPWMLGTWVEMYYERLHPKDQPLPPLANLRKLFVVFFGWVSTPVLIFLFWVRYLPKHDPLGSFLHILLFAVTLFAARYFYDMVLETMQFRKISPWSWGRLIHLEISFSTPFIGLVLLVTTIAIWGNSTNFPLYKHYMVLDLAGMEISKKPGKWNIELEYINPYQDEKTIKALKEKHREQLSRAKGVKWQGVNLNSVYAPWVFLANSDLKKAQLRGANIINANLEGAKLYRANLRGADLRRANLEGANLEYSILYGVRELNFEQVKKAKNGFQAIYDPSFIKTWPEVDRNAYMKNLPQWLPDAAEFHYVHEPKKEKLQKLNEWYCLYKLPKCKKPEADKGEKPKAAPAK